MAEDKDDEGSIGKTWPEAIATAIGALHRLGAGLTLLVFVGFVYWQSSEESKARLLNAILSGEGEAGWLWTFVFLLCVLDMVIGVSAWLRRRFTEARRVRQLQEDKARLEQLNMKLTQSLADTKAELNQTQLHLNHLEQALFAASDPLVFPEESVAVEVEPAVHQAIPKTGASS